MVAIWDQLEATKADRVHVLQVLEFSADDSDVLDSNNISDVTHLIITRRRNLWTSVKLQSLVLLSL